MQEIAPHIYIETDYAGVTLGAVNWQHGLLLVDSPFRLDDTRNWRASLQNLRGGLDRMLVTLDAQVDRTLGSRAMECTIISHEQTAEVFRNRPLTFKPQSSETGAEWELFGSPGSVRWAPPEMTFTDELLIHGGEIDIQFEYHPGSAIGSIWIVLPAQRIIFLGDAVVPDQPPFLASADLPQWMENLQSLQQAQYRDWWLVSGRGGLVTPAQVRQQLRFLDLVHNKLEAMAVNSIPADATVNLVADLLAHYKIPQERQAQFKQRLKWGLRQYYLRHYFPTSLEIVDD